jgi:hypothetical protein
VTGLCGTFAAMSDFALPQPAVTALHPRVLLGAGRGSASFGDLVQARWNCTHAIDDADREHYHAKHQELLRRFQAEHGEIIHDYWSESAPAAVAVTSRPLPFGRAQQLALHRRTEQLSASRPEFSRLLLRIDRQAVRGSNVLAGMSQRIAITNLYSLTRDVTAYLEADREIRLGRSKNGIPEHDATVSAYNSELKNIAHYVGEAGSRQAQIIYLQGMMRGLLALIVLAPLLALMFRAIDVPGLDSTLFVACLIAGSFGAAMSVLMRMSGGRFVVNHEVGREYVTNLGFARPFIGAVFAVLLYFAFRGELLQQVEPPSEPQGAFAFFVASGFVIGFSERFAKEIVRAADQSSGDEVNPSIPEQRESR